MYSRATFLSLSLSLDVCDRRRPTERGGQLSAAGGCRKKYSACIHAHVLARVAASTGRAPTPLLALRSSENDVRSRNAELLPLLFCRFSLPLFAEPGLLYYTKFHGIAASLRRPCNISAHVRTSSKTDASTPTSCSTRELYSLSLSLSLSRDLSLFSVKLAARLCAPTCNYVRFSTQCPCSSAHREKPCSEEKETIHARTHIRERASRLHFTRRRFRLPSPLLPPCPSPRDGMRAVT